jgi:membrane complex biogenesis BtpA family protein
MPVELAFQLLGVIHLPTLPGSPRPSEGMDFVLDSALRDAEALVEGGIHSCIVENFWDSPFPADHSAPHVAACMASVLTGVSERFGKGLRLGVNVLRNDARSALGVARAVGAGLVRVNVHVGSTWTDQGLIQSRAHALLQYRRGLGLDMPHGAPLWTPGRTAIAADVMVKHGAPAGGVSLLETARDAVLRGGADVVILTGNATGQAADADQMSAVREALPETPVWVGSGVEPTNAPLWKERASGAIVGSFLHRNGDLRAPLDTHRVRQIADLLG